MCIRDSYRNWSSGKVLFRLPETQGAGCLAESLEVMLAVPMLPLPSSLLVELPGRPAVLRLDDRCGCRGS